MRRAFIKYKGQYRYAEKMVSTREQSEFLLKMILPEKIIETLRKYDGNPTERAKVSMHDTFIELSGVTILFADIVG